MDFVRPQNGLHLYVCKMLLLVGFCLRILNHVEEVVALATDKSKGVCYLDGSLFSEICLAFAYLLHEYR